MPGGFGRPPLCRGRVALASGLRRPPVSLGPLFLRPRPAVAGVAQPLAGQIEITLQPLHLHARRRQATLHLGPPHLRRRPLLHPGFPLALPGGLCLLGLRQPLA